LAPAPAAAGAWIAPAGGQEIWTSVAGERDEQSFYETSAYWEAPVGDELSVVAAPWLEQNYDTVEGWRAEAVVGLKHAVLRRGPLVMAVQAGAVWESHPDLGCSEGGAELRWLGGLSIGAGGFVNVEAATRALEGGCESERFDLTLGYRPNERWMGMAQLFVDAPRGGEEAFVKAQFTLVRFGDSGRGLQIGLRARLDGGVQEPALVIGLWGRPGD